MNNREKYEKVDSVHLFVALRRPKENPGLPEICRRVIIRNEEADLMSLKKSVSTMRGTWRIYKTVNARKCKEASKLALKQYIDEPEKFEDRLDILWRNCLLKPENKAEKKYLLDIDKRVSYSYIWRLLKKWDVSLDEIEIIGTPNGWHVICTGLDSRNITEDYVSFSRDGVYFVERFIIK